MKSRVISATVCLILAALASATVWAQDPVKTLPETYKVQFENEWVRVLRVHLAGGAKLPVHDHPKVNVVYVYLNDADEVIFRHERGPGTITRPAVKARSYRLSSGGDETHAIENTSPNASDYVRLDLKSARGRAARRRGPAPTPKTDNAADIEFTDGTLRITRITIGPGKSMELNTTASEPALLIALTDTQLTVARGSSMNLSMKIGQEHWIDTRQRELMSNTGTSPIELLRFDFLTRPQ